MGRALGGRGAGIRLSRRRLASAWRLQEIMGVLPGRANDSDRHPKLVRVCTADGNDSAPGGCCLTAP